MAVHPTTIHMKRASASARAESEASRSPNENRDLTGLQLGRLLWRHLLEFPNRGA